MLHGEPPRATRAELDAGEASGRRRIPPEPRTRVVPSRFAGALTSLQPDRLEAKHGPREAHTRARRPLISIALFCSMLTLSAVTLWRYALPSDSVGSARPAAAGRAQVDDARRALESAAALAPKTRVVVMPRDWSDAEASPGAAPETDHESDLVTLRKQADRAFAVGEVAEAERLYARVLELEDENPRAAHGLARIRLSQGNLAGAEGWIQLAVRKRPRRASYHALYAVILTRLGREEEALEERLRAASGVQSD